jgi:redox-sensitive bicupin YhaK (pirin superfamily)
MKSIIHKAESRGHADYDWLKTNYTFSFANYYNPERIHFGALRVLNDDWIGGGKGFDKHPHDNMEIVTIPLDGEVQHKDSMGHTSIIRPNDVQVMSAGTGIFHSEYNNLPDKPLQLLQIWVFPDSKNLTPRYDQKTFNTNDRMNQWQTLVSPNNPESLKIHQNAWFSLLQMDDKKNIDYVLNDSKNGLYVFVIEGSIEIHTTKLDKRDGMGIWQAECVTLKSLSTSTVLAIEIPMLT